MFRLREVGIESILIAGLLLTSLFDEVAQADAPECGEWITHDIKLGANLYCDSEPFLDALVVGADGVTIDLNGYTIVGAGEQSGVYSGGFSNLTIKNGAITGFIHGILVGEGANIEIRQLTLANQHSDSILVIASNKVEIKDVQISLPQMAPGSDITLVDVDGAMVKRVTATGNGFTDMSHSEDSTPNLWRGNTCQTSDEGVEVDCQ